MSSDWWDDFFNNLATDLAPLVSLFGESPTKQFLSESVSLIDIFIFSMAPLGIITAVVSAIRVGGSPSLRAFIGRAQEGGGNIEAELCSSTSRDVCEMYNNGGIARVFGRPKILEIVHDPHADTKDFYGLEGKEKSAGVYSFKEYIESVNGGKEWEEVTGNQNILRSWKKAQKEPESQRFPKDAINTDFAPHPNLSLNVGIKKRSPIWFFLVAVIGLLLQSGVLVFAGLSVSAFSKRFEKDDKSADAYAFPFTLTGTLLVCIGVGMCGHIVERSTKERIFRRKAATLENGLRSRLFWIQPGNQVIGDQVFDPFAYNDIPGAPLNEYTTSGRNIQDTELQRTKNLLVWIFVPVTVFGFILQFIGLRALHSTISIAQLGVTILMSIIRSMLRTERLRKEDNRLGNDPDFFQGHELDWLAMELYRNKLKEELIVRHTETQPNHFTFTWQVATFPTHSGATLVADERLYACSDTKATRIVSVSTNDPAIVLLSGFRSVPKSDPSDSNWEDKKIDQWLAETQQKERSGVPRLIPLIFLSRARIARMTGVDPRFGSSRGDSSQWAEDVVPARDLAATLADALRRTVDVLFSNYTAPPVLKDGWANASTLFLGLDCNVAKLSTSDETIHYLENPQNDVVYITLSRTATDQGEIDGQWNSDTSEIEAILSLWMWSLRTRSWGTTKINNSSSLPRKTSLERLRSTRLLFISGSETDGGSSSETALHQSTLSPWLGDLGTKVRKVRLTYPTTSGFNPTWIWTRTADGMRQTGDQTVYTPMALHLLQHRRPTDNNDWFFGWDLLDRHPLPQQQPHWDLDALITRTDHSLAVMCAQEIYTKLFRNLLNILEDIGGETKVMKGRHGFYLANDNITEIIGAFTDSGLGSENDARACIIPALLEKEKLPVVSMVARARDLGDEYRKDGAWKKAEEVLRWALDTSLRSWKQCKPDPEVQGQEASTASEDLGSTTSPRDPERELWLCVVALCECYRWALFCEDKHNGYRQFGAEGIIKMLKLRQTLPHLTDTLNIYGKVSLRVAKESPSVLTVHDLTYLEHMLGDYATSSNIKNAKSSPEGDESSTELLQSNGIKEERGSSTDSEESNGSPEGGDNSIRSHEPSQENPKENVISAIKAGDMSAALYHLRSPSAIQEDHEGRSSLSWAAEKGWFIVVKSLIEVGSTARQSDIFARTPLHFAAFSGDKYLVTYLLEQGVDVNSRDAKHRTPLFMATEHEHNEIINTLLKGGASITALDNEKRSLLHFATSTRIVTSLLEQGLDVNCRDANGRTPLLTAVNHGHNEIVKGLLEAGADANACDNDSNSPLLRATWNGNSEAVECLLSSGAKTTGDYVRNFSLLSIAVTQNSMKVIRLLLKAGVNPNIYSVDVPSWKNHKHIGEFRDLIGKYRSVDKCLSIERAFYSLGWSVPLHLAAEFELTDVVEELLKYGADPTLVDWLNLSKNGPIFRLIWQKMKDSGHVPEHNFLSYAIRMDFLDVVEWTLAQPGVCPIASI